MAEEAPSNPTSTTPTNTGSVDDKVDEPTLTDSTADDTQGTCTSIATTTAGDNAVPDVTNSGAYSVGSWQAIWSPAHAAYYFYNSATRETTWINPIQQGQQQTEGKGKENAAGETEDDDANDKAEEDDEKQGAVAGPSTTNATGTMTPSLTQWEQMQANAIAQGIDPSLAHLDPSLATGPSSSLPSGAFTARFNARTGAFTGVDGREPAHLSEYERARRMSQFYFDVGAWEKELEQREAAEEEGKKKRKPTKKDLDRFKEQKRQKKIAKTAWLRT
ncbi:hypothetical protein BJ322DRAFT_1023316 [Thelephora terrestris]|uniref:WW domain-containing protein n=1 Tax=Thelephora terrestris TaxID=56493 RepID=A0A9P6H8E0_9AGAM|nr:hypothetical protein BJ322DRAFT_1023316 [Thelephora terrestris]